MIVRCIRGLSRGWKTTTKSTGQPRTPRNPTTPRPRRTPRLSRNRQSHQTTPPQEPNTSPFTEPQNGNLLTQAISSTTPSLAQVSSSRPLLSPYYLPPQTNASTHRSSHHVRSSSSPFFKQSYTSNGRLISPCTTTRRSATHHDSHQTRSPQQHHQPRDERERMGSITTGPHHPISQWHPAGQE